MKTQLEYTTEITVRLEKKVIGKIKKEGEFWYYFPKGYSKGKSEGFRSLDDLKFSLEQL